MTDNTKNQKVSEWMTVGEMISEILESNGMKQSELCNLTGIAKPVLNEVIKERRNLTAEMAVLIESALGLSADMLLTLQMQNELDKAYNDSKAISQLQSMSDWGIMSEYLSMPVLKKLGLLKNQVAENVSAAMQMLHVKNIKEFDTIAKQEQGQAYYKKSDKLTVDKKALFTWKYYCVDVASNIHLDAVFTPNDIDDLKQEAKKILLENNNTYNRMKMAFNSHGIRLLYIGKEGQIPVDGMSFWIGDNPTVIITRRLQNIDNFAFAVMHELGHVKMHLKKDSHALLNLDGKDLDEKEAEANEYARDAFVSKDEWRRFMLSLKDVNPYSVHIYIAKEAKKLNVNPQILYGRYMHDTNLSRLRRVFPIDVQ